MDQNENLLNTIYQNTKMGSDTLNEVLPKITDAGLRNEIVTQIASYDAIKNNAVRILGEMGKKPKDNSLFKRGAAAWGTKVNTAVDSSVGHIAEMIVKGYSTGVLELSKELSKSGDCNPEVHTLGRDLLRTEEDNLHKIKSFL